MFPCPVYELLGTEPRALGKALYPATSLMVSGFRSSLFLLFNLWLGIKPRASCLHSRCSATERYPLFLFLSWFVLKLSLTHLPRQALIRDPSYSASWAAGIAGLCYQAQLHFVAKDSCGFKQVTKFSKTQFSGNRDLMTINTSFVGVLWKFNDRCN